MEPNVFHTPTEIELAFLRIVAQGYPEIEQQVAHCQITDYNLTGWCDVNVLAGPSSPIRYLAPGPAARTVGPDGSEFFVDTILTVNDAGMLYTVEIVVYLGLVDAPYAMFVEAARAGHLTYPESRESF